MRVRRKLSISLTKELDYLARAAVKSGLYASVSEVVRAALRTWQAANPDVDAAANAAEPPTVPRRRGRRARARRRRGDPSCGLTERQCFDLEVMAGTLGCRRLALLGSMRKLKVRAAAHFGKRPAGFADTESVRSELEFRLRRAWDTQVTLVLMDQLPDLDGWTVVYDAGLLAEASDTESSSTS